MLNRNKSYNLTSLREKVVSMSTPKNGGNQNTQQDFKDERLWKLEVDKAGTGSAVIRFLPAKEGEEFPFVQRWSHGFQVQPSGKWFIDNCPSTLGGVPSDVCPVCLDNTTLWNASKDKEDPRKKISSLQKRKLHYYSNILVINDPKHPENNGKVFIFKYGKKIFEKIKDSLVPEFADMTSVDPFDLIEGADFKLRQVKGEGGWPNFDKSTFDSPSAIGDEERIVEIENQLYTLSDIADEKQFKSFETLKKKFITMTGGSTFSNPLTSPTKTSEAPPFDEEATTINKPNLGRTVTPKTTKTVEAPVETSVDEDEDYFAKLAAKATQS